MPGRRKSRVGKFATLLSQRMRDLKLSIDEVADLTESSYEFVRRWTKGTSFPSKYKVRELAAALKINTETLQEAVALDQITGRYGSKILALLSQKTAGIDRLEIFWEHLSEAQREDLITLAEAWYRKSRMPASKGSLTR